MSHVATEAVSAPLRLRLVTDEVLDEPADDGRVLLSPQMTLSEFFAAFHKPAVLIPRDTKDRTLSAYEESLDYWRRFTGDPPLCEIDYVVTGHFYEGLKSLPGKRKGTTMAKNTIRKHCNAIQQMLDIAGQPERKRRQAAGLLQRVPYVERPPEQETDRGEESFTIAEIADILAACPRAKRRRFLMAPTPIFWRAFVTFAFNVGFRIETLMAIEWTMIDEAWIKVPPGCIKKGRGASFYLNAATLEALQPLRAFKQHSPRIFPWPNYSHNNHTNIREHHAHLLREAGLPPERLFGFHAYRRAHGHYLNLINPNASTMSLNHKQSETTRRSYIRKATLSESLDKMPRPAAKSAGDEQQLLLF